MQEDAELRVMSLIINFEVVIRRYKTEKDLIDLLADTLDLGHDPETGAPWARISEELAKQLYSECEEVEAKALIEQLEGKGRRALNARAKRRQNAEAGPDEAGP